jgi:hypothetical protein
MSTSDIEQDVYRPACQARSGAECANCSLSYDCVKARAGRAWAWPLVALVLVGVVALLT